MLTCHLSRHALSICIGLIRNSFASSTKLFSSRISSSISQLLQYKVDAVRQASPPEPETPLRHQIPVRPLGENRLRQRRCRNALRIIRASATRRPRKPLTHRDPVHIPHRARCGSDLHGPAGAGPGAAGRQSHRLRGSRSPNPGPRRGRAAGHGSTLFRAVP
jgi:hypothetical protein